MNDPNDPPSVAAPDRIRFGEMLISIVLGAVIGVGAAIYKLLPAGDSPLEAACWIFVGYFSGVTLACICLLIDYYERRSRR